MNVSTPALTLPGCQARPAKRRVSRRTAIRRAIVRRRVPPCPYRRYEQARVMMRRLNLAYNDLWHQGILGGHDLDCHDFGCQEAMRERADVEVRAGRKIVGFCYYGDFDSDDLDETGVLYLGWDPYERDSPCEKEIGMKIQAALEDRGLMTRWDGSETMKIEIYGLKEPWKNHWACLWSPPDATPDLEDSEEQGDLWDILGSFPFV